MEVFDRFDDDFRRMEKEMKKMRKTMFNTLKGYETRLF